MLEHAINLAQIRYRKDDRDNYLARVKRERHDPFGGTRFEFVFKHTATSSRLSLDRSRISLGDDAASLQIRGEVPFAPLARIHRHQRAMFNEYARLPVSDVSVFGGATDTIMHVGAGLNVPPTSAVGIC